VPGTWLAWHASTQALKAVVRANFVVRISSCSQPHKAEQLLLLATAATALTKPPKSQHTKLKCLKSARKRPKSLKY
jgi:hypothetical protein